MTPACLSPVFHRVIYLKDLPVLPMLVYNQPYVRLLTLLYICTPSSHRLLLSSPPRGELTTD